MPAGVSSLVQRSPDGCTAITTLALLTSMPTEHASIAGLLDVVPPYLMRVRGLAPFNCPGSATSNAEERPRCEAALEPGERRATLPRGVVSDFEDIRREEIRR